MKFHVGQVLMVTKEFNLFNYQMPSDDEMHEPITMVVGEALLVTHRDGPEHDVEIHLLSSLGSRGWRHGAHLPRWVRGMTP